eukprot:CAMPEP_0175833314 /NCGR_PEP_ID=MMETSP0107_2-20121207/15445_1 /TAXON_ID=195067 ORGANISM="Goniomonas pacifica, Strain CCMP1869" /NCGR_SAMPLE_ID=MMETSP0107_2 /ASSEMBLY_ACC=CAM_ASM_000203 /LENGTH=60 /DNA_ID=CAMNT_0017146437 /DNA_START=97 /DNA_END=276 /DNA_ORIENTATION=-
MATATRKTTAKKDPHSVPLHDPCAACVGLWTSGRVHTLAAGDERRRLRDDAQRPRAHTQP